ncbi:MAG: NAD-dependent epimerase/dehydratase family protein [Chloroflexota bacterium]|nr:NAD-dependent epimerase/dehydratase family protein [Chloroflexota bacterium]
MSTLVTGGAGFIGVELIGRLLAAGERVTVLDDLSGAEPDWDDDHRAELLDGRLTFVRGNVADLAAVIDATAGHDAVIHLAANTNIPGGYGDPGLDLRGCILGTWNVAEAMRRHGVRRLLFASSGVVYGSPLRTPTDEGYGPMLPGSHYAAAKLAGEAILSGFAHLYAWRVLAFRFGNTIGPRTNHGVVHDFVVKLLRDDTRLDVIGDGQQAKPYIEVGDLVDGVLHADRMALDRPFAALNVATHRTLTVRQVASHVIEGLELDPRRVELVFTGNAPGGGGWVGDTPLVDLDADALRVLGWSPRLGAAEAVRRSARGIRDRLLAAGAPLRTTAERRIEPTRTVVR